MLYTLLLTKPIVNMITFLESRGFFAFFETIWRVFTESKVKSWLTESSRLTVHCALASDRSSEVVHKL